VAFLAELGFLNERTLCVHLVHLSDEDIKTLSQKRVRVCICPLSNQRLSAGLPPVDKLLKAGISVALGTDSLASNDDLNLFREMAYIGSRFPKIDTHEILKMGTIHGAAALGMDKTVGSMESGKEAHLIFVALEDTSFSNLDLGGAIIESGVKEGVSWL
jgi:cytosine/adenosine deaminase-related metal-dependent hydrolase